MIIKNRQELATTELRKQALDIIEAGINRVLPSVIMKSAVSYDPARRVLTVGEAAYHLRDRLFVVGGGKATALMAETLETIIPPDHITDGVVTCNCKHSDYKTNKIKIVEATHPVPDQGGLDGVAQMLALRGQYAVGKDDLIIGLFSGGASALMPCPVDEVSLEDKQRITELLLACSADIHEINAVRKHLSKTKGGGLGRFFSLVMVVSLVISDVVGNDLDVVSSGPTFPDSTTFADGYRVLEKYDLLARAPESVLEYLRKGCRGEVAETPKVLPNCRNHLIGDNTLALAAMADKARELGLSPNIITAEQKGDTVAVARLRAKEIINGSYTGYDVILIGGETTAQLPDNTGKGGRNQHYAAVSMLAMEGYPGEWVMASVGTDGSDFLPDVAGAMADHDSLAQARAKGIAVESYLERYDSNTLLAEIGGSLVVTGNTGTNVGDVIVYILR